MELSKRFRDRPKTPQEEVLYWTEYVIRHKGAQHLKSEGLKLSWYQYFLIDVLVTIVLSVLTTLIIFYFILKKAVKRIINYLNLNEIKENIEKKVK